MKKTRNSNLEIYRIICMFLIVTHHYAIHGFANLNLDFSFNKIIIDILVLGGKIGVSGFVLISGYFMINSKFTLKKFLKILGQVLFYSLIFLILFMTVLKPVSPITKQQIFRSFFPITFSAYWFITNYILLMILSPFINKLIFSLSKKELEKLIIILVVIWYVLGTFLKVDIGFSRIGCFILLYLISAYIKLYFELNKKSLSINKKVLLISVILLILSSIILNVIGKLANIKSFLTNSTYFAEINSIFVLIISVTSFILFIGKKEYSNKYINEIAKYMLGVYLIHDNFLVRPYIWHNIFKNYEFVSSNFLILHAILSINILFILNILIDFLRMKLLEPIWMKFTDYILDKINIKLAKRKKNNICID